MTVQTEQDFINMKLYDEDPIQADRSPRTTSSSSRGFTTQKQQDAALSPSKMTYLEMENSMDYEMVGRPGPISDFQPMDETQERNENLSTAPSSSDQFSVHRGQADFDSNPNNICKFYSPALYLLAHSHFGTQMTSNLIFFIRCPSQEK